MRAHEFLSEYISLTKYKHDITSKLNELGDMVIPHKLIKYSISNRWLHNGTSLSVVKSFIERLVYEVDNDIKNKLASIVSEIIGKNISVDIVNQRTRGSAGYDHIKLGIDIDALEEFTVNRIIRTHLMSDGTIDEVDGELRITDIDEFWFTIEHLTYSKFEILDMMMSMIDTIIHELVHIIQHSKQPRHGVKGKGTEYRSKLTSQDKFYDAVRAISSGNPTDEDYKIYYSSLQEIPAHAHNAVIDILKSYSFPNRKMTGTDLYTVSQNIDKLKNDLKKLSTGDKQWGSMMSNSSGLRYYASTFNKPNEPALYAVYKRFIKLVYQELTRYVAHWESQIPKSKSYQYDVYLDGKKIDSIRDSSTDKEDVRRGLINHDGYDPNIVIKRG